MINKKALLKKALGEKLTKRGMSISIVLLVILTLVLAIMIIGYFVVNDKGTSATLNIPNQVDYVNFDSDNFNFYFNNMFQRVAGDFSYSDGSGAFIEKLRDELGKTVFYPPKGSYIEYSHLDESNVELTADHIALTLDVSVSNSSSQSGNLGIKYNYTKRFVKKFN
jgi:hypothetical protein